MDRPTIHFCSGLPRAGSTLLQNVLAQNPRFHCTATSGLVDICMMIKNGWDKLEPMRAIPDSHRRDQQKIDTVRGAVYGYFERIEEPVIVDKSRGWLAEMEMMQTALMCDLKVLVCVRDLREVLASFERLYRKTKATRQLTQEINQYWQCQTTEGRAQLLASHDNIVGGAFNRIRDAVNRGFRKQMHFIDFEDLTRHPQQTLKDVYEFLGEDLFEHDFENVEQVTLEDDSVYVWKDLHAIRPKIEPVESYWRRILQGVIPEQNMAAYSRDAFFWKEYL